MPTTENDVLVSTEDDNLTQLEPEAERPLLQQNGSYDGPEPSVDSGSHLNYRSTAPSEAEDNSPTLPRWMRESQSSSFTQWIPLPIRQFGRFLAAWSKGPDPPRIQRINPWFPKVQEMPIRLVERFLPKRRHKGFALAVILGAWLLTFSLVIKHSSESGHIPGYGRPQSIWCGANLWGHDNKCSLGGNSCRPFTGQSFPFRCNADCVHTKLYNSRAVGDQVVNFQPFVIGGPGSSGNDTPIYRGDSYICQAAIHAGIISNSGGGCGVVKLLGENRDFISTDSHGIVSTNFSSSFPKTFTFIPASECGAVDMRWPLLAVTVIFTTIISLFTWSPAVFFPAIFTMLFFHVGLVSDKPNIPAFNALFEIITSRFLPAALGSYVIYRFSVRYTLSSLTAQVEKTVLWLGAAWVGSLSNYTLSFIPIQRLTPHDLKAQPGAVVSLVIIVLIIFTIALGQVYFLQQEGRLRKYLVIYIIFIAGLLIGVAIPDLNVRIHHYILALLLLPGTRTQTRACLIYQGLLVGLYVNGTARWGFDSLLQTTAVLIGNGQTDSLLPNVTAIASTLNVTFSWPELPSAYDGLSILVNDVERKRWYDGEGEREFVWKGGRGGPEREYFRFAFMSGSRSADYTRAGVWEVGGGWTEAEEGRS